MDEIIALSLAQLLTALVVVSYSIRELIIVRSAKRKLGKYLSDKKNIQRDIEVLLGALSKAERGGKDDMRRAMVNLSRNSVVISINCLRADEQKKVMDALVQPSDEARSKFLESVAK